MRFIENYSLIETEDGVEGFVGMNSSSGFVGLYENIASENLLKRLYIIKGSSGCGKSTFMRRLAAAAKADKADVKSYLCSSDPASLDAIIINSSVAVIDGTPPHSVDMKFPGAASEIIDLTRFWDNDYLISKRGEIQTASAEKKTAYGEAYKILSVYANLRSEEQRTLLSAVNVKKLRSVCNRLVKSFMNANKIKTEVSTVTLCHRSIGMRDMCRISAFERRASNIYCVSDVYGSGFIFMNELKDQLLSEKIPISVSVDPVINEYVWEIYLPQHDILITLETCEKCKREINMQRFILSEKLSEIRGFLRLSHKCREAILNEVRLKFNTIYNSHFKLEQIYGEAIDFVKLDSYFDEKIKEILTVCF